MQFVMTKIREKFSSSMLSNIYNNCIVEIRNQPLANNPVIFSQVEKRRFVVNYF